MSRLKVDLIGRLANDCAVRVLNNGKAAINFTVATSEKWKTRDGQPFEHTTWVECVIWRSSMDKAGISKSLVKGLQVAIIGRPKLRSYISKAGEPVPVFGLVVDDITFLGRANQKANADQPETPTQQTPSVDGTGQEDDLPF